MEKGFTKEGFAFIKSVITPSAQGRHRQLRRDGAIIERTKAKGAGTYFNPSVSVKHNKLNTGFWNLIKNPYKSSKSLPEEFKHLFDKDEITIQDWLEVKYSRPKGFYTSEKPDIFNRKGATATYLQAFIYKLEDGVTVLDLDKERDHIMYLLALASNKIANSAMDVNPITHTHYIMEVNEGEADKSRTYALIEEAVSALYKLKMEHPEEVIKRMAVTLGVVKGVVTMETIKNRMSDYILNKETRQKENIDNFIAYYKLATGSKDKRELFNYNYIARELINYGIIYFVKAQYVWENSPTEEMRNVGYTVDNVVQFITTNKEAHRLLVEQLENKTGLKFPLNP